MKWRLALVAILATVIAALDVTGASARPLTGAPGTPSAQILTGVTLHNGFVLYTESWSQGSCTPGSTYDTYYDVDGSGWSYFDSVTDNSTEIYISPADYSWQFGVDCGSALTAGPSFNLNSAQEGSATYRGAWSLSCFPGAWGGCAEHSSARGASASFRFFGNTVAWVTDEDATHGSARVYIDGVSKKTVNTQNPGGKLNQQVVYKYTWPADGWHTLKIVNLGTAGHPRVNVDGFLYVE